jgi:hypothetical protein
MMNEPSVVIPTLQTDDQAYQLNNAEKTDVFTFVHNDVSTDSETEW